MFDAVKLQAKHDARRSFKSIKKKADSIDFAVSDKVYCGLLFWTKFVAACLSPCLTIFAKSRIICHSLSVARKERIFLTSSL